MANVQTCKWIGSFNNELPWAETRPNQGTIYYLISNPAHLTLPCTLFLSLVVQGAAVQAMFVCMYRKDIITLPTKAHL